MVSLIAASHSPVIIIAVFWYVWCIQATSGTLWCYFYIINSSLWFRLIQTSSARGLPIDWMFFICIFTLLILLIRVLVLNLWPSRSTSSMPSWTSIVTSPNTMIGDTYMGLWRKVIILFFIVLWLSPWLVQISNMVSIIHLFMAILHWTTLCRYLHVIIKPNILWILLLITYPSVVVITIIPTLIWMSSHLFFHCI